MPVSSQKKRITPTSDAATLEASSPLLPSQQGGRGGPNLDGVAPSASAISRLGQSLTHQFEAWRERPLQEHWRIVYLDGVHFSIRQYRFILSYLPVQFLGDSIV